MSDDRLMSSNRKRDETPAFIPYPTIPSAPAAPPPAAADDADEREEEDDDEDDDEGGSAPALRVEFMKPMTPSADLARVVGAEPQPRVEVMKRLWAYIKKHGLQDKKNPRMINADDNLRAIFDGQDSVSMFEMTRLVNRHLE